MLLPPCFLTAFVRLPASAQPFHLAVARYAFDEMPAHLLDNRTKSVKDANDRLGIIPFARCAWQRAIATYQRGVKAISKSQATRRKSVVA
ncbi:hypothetical protein [Prevotella falsenii]|uniref:hypothetical protein n=1 Tax=Prevotella falsenii TaxID=515414 RepID=UPI00055B6433|nr:hypothetical protein [Prevotella falsenii]